MSAIIITARLGVSRRADAWDEELQSLLRNNLSTLVERNTDVSHWPGEGLAGGR